VYFSCIIGNFRISAIASEDVLNIRNYGKFPALFALLLLCFCGLDPFTVEPPLIICDHNFSEPPAPNAARFGIFDPRLYSNYAGCLTTLTEVLGAHPGFILWFQQIDDPFPVTKVTSNAAIGIKTVISMNVRSLTIDSVRNDTLLREIGAGLWDSTLTAFAQQAAAISTPVYLRFGYEMNGGWFSWGKQPAEFVAAWNHAHRIFQRAGAINIEWVFSPGVLFGTMSPDIDLIAYYPGDSVVDIVGLDGYNFGNCIDQWNNRHYWQDFRTIFERSLFAIRSFDKPIWIAEAGCPSDPRRPEWLGELFAFMDNNPCVETVFWFNGCKSGEPDFRIESDSASLAVMREWLKR
jgi:hypothetical protein